MYSFTEDRILWSQDDVWKKCKLIPNLTLDNNLKFDTNLFVLQGNEN